MANGFDSIRIRKARLSDIQEIAAISSSSFGHGYLEETQIRVFLTNFNTSIYLSLNNEKIVGFILCCLENNASFSKNYPQISIESKSKNMLIIRSIAIDKEFRSRGFGEALLNYALSNKAMAYDEAISINWKSGNNIPFGRTCEKLGLLESIEVKNYWKTDSENRAYYCPKCGRPPCKCSAVIFRKKFRD